MCLCSLFTHSFYALVLDISVFYASYAFVRFSNHSIHPVEGSDLLTVDANIRALEKMAEGVKTGFTILSLLMGKLTLNILQSSKETNFKFVHIIFAFWVVSFSNRQCYKEL